METPSKRVLIVNDERHILRLLSVNFKRNGWIVQPELDGIKALKTISEQSFDFAILDFSMPYPNGYDLLKVIREDDERKSMRVWLLTKSAQETESLMKMPYLADHYSHSEESPRWSDWFR